MAYIKRIGKRSDDWNYGGPKWKLSRSKIDLFVECPRCFYLDNKLGVSRPKGPSFTLNIAVDALLKKEFDTHRVNKTTHPLMARYGVDAIPFNHPMLNDWRENFVGIQHRHSGTGLLISGAIDDVWVNPKGELMIVDYKATSKDGKIESLSDSGWDEQYKRQMEVYQWLLRKLGFKVSNTGYFVYVNGKKDREAFDGKLEFDVTLIPHVGTDIWVDGRIEEIKKCLDSESVPQPHEQCEFCGYRKIAGDALRPFAQIAQAKAITPAVEKEVVIKKKIVASKKKESPEKTTSLF
jgi:CRISPR/Cas system-associated exonuclease Cas4 (RecB family)